MNEIESFVQCVRHLFSSNLQRQLLETSTMFRQGFLWLSHSIETTDEADAGSADALKTFWPRDIDLRKNYVN